MPADCKCWCDPRSRCGTCFCCSKWDCGIGTGTTRPSDTKPHSTCCPRWSRSSPAPRRPRSHEGCTTPIESSATGWSPCGAVSTSPGSLAQPGVVIPMHCKFTEFTADLIENSYLKAAVSRSLRVAGVQPIDRRRLMQHLVTLEDVGDARHHHADSDRVVFTRLNEHYKPALRLARLVLANLTLQDAVGATQASSFMLDMNDLFERFVTERLRRALRGRLEVKDQHRDRFDEDRRVAIRPDLLFSSQGTAKFVADIKYKLTDDGAGGRTADYYQLLAYATALDLPEGVLIYCLNANLPDDPDDNGPIAGVPPPPCHRRVRFTRRRGCLIGSSSPRRQGAAHLRAGPVWHHRRRGQQCARACRLDCPTRGLDGLARRCIGRYADRSGGESQG